MSYTIRNYNTILYYTDPGLKVRALGCPALTSPSFLAEVSARVPRVALQLLPSASSVGPGARN